LCDFDDDDDVQSGHKMPVIFSADDKNNSAGDKQLVLSTAASGTGANRKLYMVSLNTAIVKGHPGRYTFSMQ
jgi:hypothetical protein